MSRRKNQTVKLFTNYFRAGQFQLCGMGEVFAYDKATAELISDIQSLAGGPPLSLCKTAAQRQRMLKEHERGQAEVGATLAELFTSAVKTGNLERINRLTAATAMASRGAVSPNYMWLWAYLGKHAKHPSRIWNTPAPWAATVSFDQVRNAYADQYDSIEDSQLRQMVKALGWTLVPDKPGPKVRNNSR